MGENNAPGAIRRWIIHHEDSWVFVALYVALAVVLSAFISLFWLVVLAFAHLLMEAVSHAAHHDEARRVWGESLWAVKLDFGLVLFAFTLTLYLPFVFGILGLGAATRAAAAGSRFLVVQRTIRAALLSADDAVLVARGIMRGRRPRRFSTAQPSAPPAQAEQDNGTARTSHGTEPEPTRRHTHGPRGAPHDPPAWRGNWSLGDWIAVSFTGISLALVLLSPFLTDHTLVSAFEDIAAELRPW